MIKSIKDFVKREVEESIQRGRWVDRKFEYAELEGLNPFKLMLKELWEEYLWLSSEYTE